MKIALVHCYYLQRGGEDGVFEQERKMLETSNQVCSFVHSNQPGWKGLLQFLLSIHNPFIAGKFRAFLVQELPDLVHIHNWHFATGPVLIQVAQKRNIPVVITLHNYRLLCPSATLVHQGKLFTSSVNVAFPWQAVSKRVYRGSILLTFWMAFLVRWNKWVGTWQKVTRFIALTPFAREIHLNSYLSLQNPQLVVKSNFVVDRGFEVENRGSHFLFVGRLTEEKGIMTLLEACRLSALQLTIIGDGPLRKQVEEMCAASPHLTYLGPKSNPEIIEHMKTCTALIFPSIWYEGMPLTILEAFSCGTPVIASRLGAMKDMISNEFNGMHFEAGNAIDLSQKLISWQARSADEITVICNNARKTYEEYYAPEINEKELLAIYASAISDNREGRR
jgi:glycosyltransferase involved in cell wall biosynthesis